MLKKYVYPFAVKVINNRAELLQAVDAFLVDEEKRGQERGRILYPIGEWDVSKVVDFSFVFSKLR